MKLRIFVIKIVLIGTIGCQKDDDKIESKNEIIGEWTYEYQLMSDGTKNFDNPYSILEFEYSDGFILKKDGTGNSIWNDGINEDFEWKSENSGSKLIISLIESDDKFEYKISNLKENSMDFETPRGRKYAMKKK